MGAKARRNSKSGVFWGFGCCCGNTAIEPEAMKSFRSIPLNFSRGAPGSGRLFLLCVLLPRTGWRFSTLQECTRNPLLSMVCTCAPLFPHEACSKTCLLQTPGGGSSPVHQVFKPSFDAPVDPHHEGLCQRCARESLGEPPHQRITSDTVPHTNQLNTTTKASDPSPSISSASLPPPNQLDCPRASRSGLPPLHQIYSTLLTLDLI